MVQRKYSRKWKGYRQADRKQCRDGRRACEKEEKESCTLEKIKKRLVDMFSLFPLFCAQEMKYVHISFKFVFQLDLH